MSKPLRMGIVGSGIGGLALAVALQYYLSNQNSDKHIVQVQVDVYEATAELKQVGAGITLWPRALEILHELGFQDVLASRLSTERALELQSGVHVYRKSDQKEGVTILEQQTQGSQLFHRSELQELLLNRLSSNSEFVHIHTSHRLVAYALKEKNSLLHEHEVELTFTNGATASCDLLVGADGLNSTVRGYLLTQAEHYINGSESIRQEEAKEAARPIWSGKTVYRELLDANTIRRESPNFRALKKLTVYLGKSKHIVSYPVSQGKFVNIVMFFSDSSKEGTYLEGPPISTDIAHDIVSEFKGWEEDVRVIAKHMAKPSRWALQTVKPMETYVSHRVILMGDAAHAMETHLANGAGQSIEDAYILANIITKALQKIDHTTGPDITEITRIYDAVRRPFGNFAIETSRNQGRLYDISAPGYENVKEGELISSERLAELGERIERGFDWVRESAKSELEKAFSMMEK